MNKISHFIIAPDDWGDSGLVFRRHRIAEKISKNKFTKNIYWIFPSDNNKLINGVIYENVNYVSVPKRKYKSIFQGSNKELEKLITKVAPNKCERYLWYTIPSMPKLTSLGWARVIYDCSDNWSEFWFKSKGLRRLKNDTKSYIIRKSEHHIVSHADNIFATSNYLEKKLKNITKQEVSLIENGVDEHFFSNYFGNELESVPSPRVGFIGALKKKIDFDLLLKFAEKNPMINLILVGPISNDSDDSLKILMKLKNVYYFSGINIKVVPQFMAQLDVGLLPYKQIEYNKAVSPLKLFEYLSTGIPVVGIGLPATEKHLLSGVYYYSYDESDFSRKVIEALNNNEGNLVAERIKYAEKQKWGPKLDEVMKEINLF